METSNESLFMIVASYGGGVNSTAMLIGCVERRLQVDHILFADTGGELPETYEFNELFSKWLMDRGMPQIVTVKSPNVTLEQDCLTRHALPSIAYGFATCSQRFKKEPQEKYLNEITKGNPLPIIKLIGFDAGEWHRIRHDDGLRYPLVEWGWFRRDCLDAIDRAGLCPPVKSACFFCPMRKKHEIRQLRIKHPDLLQRSIAMEKNADLTTIKGLGIRWSWDDFAKADEAQDPLFPDAFAEKPCTCMEGE